MGCPGHTRTKPRKKLAVASLPGTRRTTAARRRPPPRSAQHKAARCRAKRGACSAQPPRERGHHGAQPVRFPLPSSAQNSCNRSAISQPPRATSCKEVAQQVRKVVATSRTPCGRQSRPCAASVQVPHAHMRTVEGARSCTVAPWPIVTLMASRRLAPTSFTRKPALQTVGGDYLVQMKVLPLNAQFPFGNHESSTSVTLNGSRIHLAVGPQPLWLRNHNFGLPQRIMVKRLATSRHDPLGITDSACKNQLFVVSIQYGPFNTYIPIRSAIIGKSRVARDPIAMHTSWRSNSDITSVTRVSMTFRVMRTNQYNQDLGLIHSTNGNHLESSNEGSSIDHQVTIYLHAQNITMFPTNETWYFASQMLVSSSGGLILILMAQSTRNEFRIHSDH
ncbi:hypothetical protein F511_03974 [Dorcoceras hygrometricum]|uniref:Triacylglycerol lipase n=1 Tax=Dorcoceras hygrometricum TaxID=472368 RepID=A0A2Z7D876_9LAMI|nr:hypothetical protein F511_03974 [Dorcoceras hygrometricum]